MVEWDEGGGKEVGKEEGGRPLDNRGDKESIGSTAATTNSHDGGGGKRD